MWSAVEEHLITVYISTSIFALLTLAGVILAGDDIFHHKTRNAGSAAKGLKLKPNWRVLNVLNYVIMLVFCTSVLSTIARSKNNLISDIALISSSGQSIFSHPLFPTFVLWLLCLTYFFGFFGISFIDKDVLAESPSTFGLAELQIEADKRTHRARIRSMSIQQPASSATQASSATSCQQQTSMAESHDDINYEELSDEEVLKHLLDGRLKDYQLEKRLGDLERAVLLRRELYENILKRKLDLIPYTGYDYNKVVGANCEIVIGYVPLPCGIVGPLLINGEPIYVPMATTEGCLVASTNRGCKAISASGGCNAVLLKDAITRAPCLRMPSAIRAAAIKHWLNVPANYAKIEAAFNSTTSYGRLESIDSTIAGRNIYLRFCCMSGDAMGMNMVSKGCLKAIEVLELEFPDLVLVAISGNMCTDKKPAAINWILGRGKSVVVEAIIPDKIVKNVLKSSVHDMIETNKQKNHIGSAMAGSIGGFNAHAANIVTAVYLATGQDPAQNVESSNCLTIMEYAEDGQSLYVSCTMPSIEVGTVGGGTHLPAQAGCLDICGVRGAAKGKDALPGDNARKLAQIVASAVLAGELSLMAALAANHLVRSHMQHNRKPTDAAPSAVEVNASLLRRVESTPVLSLSTKH